MGDSFLPFHVPDISDVEVRAVSETLRSGWLTTGPKAKEFENLFAAGCGAGHAIAVNSCTAALHLSLAALGIGPGHEVITTPLTFCSTVNTILQVGAKPILVDVGPDLNIAPDRVAEAITPQTRAIVPVHFAGLPCRMDAIWEIARRHGVHVVEDAAHAAGASYRGIPIGGGASDAVAFSFYATKNLTTGEGGMLTTSSAELERRIRRLCLHGMSRDAWNRYATEGSWYYEVVECGFKYNLPDILAAIGIVQLERLDGMNARRAEIAAEYNAALGSLPELVPPPQREDSIHAWHLYVLRLNLDQLSKGRAEFIEEMRARGIGCSVHFIPIPLHPYYRQALEFRHPCQRALAEYPGMVSLPLHSRLSSRDVRRVIDAVKDVLHVLASRKAAVAT